jgi:DNA replication protein DnaC
VLLGHCACLKGLKVQYFNSMKLFGMLKYCKADGSYFREIQKIARQDLIILDDFGLKLLNNDSRLIMLEILEDRYGKKSIIASTQLPTNKWHDIIGDKTGTAGSFNQYTHYNRENTRKVILSI